MENVYEKITYQDKEIFLVKTAHVSKNSIEDVKKIIEDVKPESICIELDEDRYNSIEAKDKWRDTDIATIIKNKKVGYLLVSVILSSFQRRMADQMNTNTGGEMVAGIQASKKYNLELVLADRNINKTFSRIWNKLGLFEKSKLLISIIMSIFEDSNISEEEINNLKQADVLETALNEVGKQFPVVKRILLDERDMYLSHMIRNAKGPKIVAIIGAAHAKGIIKNIKDDTLIDIDVLNDTSKTSHLLTIIKWLIPLTLLGIIIYTLITNRNIGINQLKSWLLWNGVLSAIGTALAFGHPLSILTAFIVAPFTSLNPLLAAGWFAGLMEAHLKKPKVKDFEDISIDTNSFSGFWKNRVTRILLVVIFANIFSSIGTLIGGFDVVKSFLISLKMF